ncbi:MAG TPA: hypothetical protein VMK05_06390, partial [Burkholderiales bacterium]|nr:hypothetical protein [Burkholderiales bacterium]
ALDLAPDHVEAHIDRGLALAALGRIEQAEQAFARAGAIDPRRVAAYVNAVDSESGSTTDRFDARVIYLVHGFERIERCDWRDFDRYVTEFDRLIRSSAAGGAPLDNRTLAHHALIVPVPDSSRLLLARAVAARIASEAPAAARSTRSVRTSTRSGGRLNIGYISPDFRNHPSAYLTRSVYALHDRDGFRVHCYSLTGDDGSAVRREIESACDAFRDVTSLGADEAARAIAQDGIDILVDLAGYTRNSRTEILALRPAPVQVSYLGFCGTMGADFIDYAVVDRTVCPAGSEANWHERLVFMPESYYVAGGAPQAGSTMPSRADAGLPERGFVFCCFNNAFKIEPSIFGVWMRLLRDVPGSVLWLLASNPAAVANLRREAEARGVAGERLVFAPFVEHDRHIARIGLADLVLDTLWYNAHTTAVDALWAGVPVVTCPGRSMAARVGASLLHAVGLPEMIAADVEEYERTARQLAAAPDQLVKLRHKLRANRTVGTAGTVAPLFDVERWVRHIEDAFRRMWVLHAAGEPAQSFAVARRPA